MNERIRELALQAKIEFTLDPTETPMRAFAECWEDELEKFAELIVWECGDLVQKYMSRFPEDHELTKQIKQHFGVEE